MNADDAFGDSERPKYLANYTQDLMSISLHGEESAPEFVKKEFQAFLERGILAYGFARIHCACWWPTIAILSILLSLLSHVLIQDM